MSGDGAAGRAPTRTGSAKLVEGSVARHLVAQTLPMMLGVAAIMSVGVVDAYFIGTLGAPALAAASFLFPVTMALSSLGVGVIAGVSSIVSRSLGAGDEIRARQAANLGVLVSGLFGLVVAALLWLFSDPLFALLRADEALRPLIAAYMHPFALGFPLLMVMMGVNGALRGQGAAIRASAPLLLYAVSNWFLDPMLINGAFGLVAPMGIAGAAWATVLGWVLGGVFALVAVQTSAIRLGRRALAGARWLAESRALLAVAGPAALSNSINPLGLAALTALLAGLGHAAVAGFGAGGRVESVAVVPLLGLSSSIGPIVGQNWGAGEAARVRRALLLAAGFSIAYGLVAAAALVVAGPRLAGLFSDDPATRKALASYLAITAWGYGGYGVAIVTSGALNAVGRAGMALAQSLARVVLVMIPGAVLLRGVLGPSGVYAGELAANLAGGLLAAALGWFVFRAGPGAGQTPRSPVAA